MHDLLVWVKRSDIETLQISIVLIERIELTSLIIILVTPKKMDLGVGEMEFIFCS